MKKSAYRKFLERKIIVADRQGFDVSAADMQTDLLKPHSVDTVRWAVSLGRALIASSFGLAKTRTQCEIARLVHRRTGKKFLLICPLGVRHQFVHEDGPVLGLRWQYCKTDEEIRNANTPFIISNYERVRDGNITPALHDFAGVSLDEGSVIRSLGSKTYQVFADLLKDIPYKFVATATPDPNETKELIYFAEFLGIMDHGQALTRFFKRDSAKAGNLQVHPLHDKDFRLWVSTWALFLYAPSDLGHSDEGYDLPPLNIQQHMVNVDHTRAWDQADNRGQRRLLLDAATGVREASTEKRATLKDRVAKMVEIVTAAPDEQWVIWCHLNDEQRAVEKALKEHGISFSSVYGALDTDEVEKRLYEWKDKKTTVFLSKPVMFGSGVNLQQCHKVVFLGVTHKFQEFIQAVHRNHRFGQTYPVDIHIIYAESEQGVMDSLDRKWVEHDSQMATMREIIRKYGLAISAIHSSLSMSIGVVRMETKEKLFTAINNDCVAELDNVDGDSVGLIHTSIPFGNHYSYTTNYEDFGHNMSDDDFWKQMEFLVPKLFRVLKPGRVAAIHVKDRILYGHQTKSGHMEVEEFSDDCVKAFKQSGFLYEGRRTIVTDVVRENASTYRLGWTEMSVDASKMGSGLPEYLLLFRKPPTSNKTSRADEPVKKDKKGYSRGRWQIDASSLWRSNGNRPLTPDEYAALPPEQASAIFKEEQLNTLYDHERHVAILEALEARKRLPATFALLPARVNHSDADMVWDDIVYMETLNTKQSQGRRENHICPLPFDIVERVIQLYSNEGDLVLDPFMGLGTVPMIAMKLDRIGYGIELNPEYFQAALKYLKQVQQEKTMVPTLFDVLAFEKVAEA